MEVKLNKLIALVQAGKSYVEAIRSLHQDLTPLEESNLRHGLTYFYLSRKLNQSEPEDAWIVATADGRSIAFATDNTLVLDVGTQPRHWSEDRAIALAERWNRDAPPKDNVKPIYWRDHYKVQMQRIVDQLDASPSSGKT